jgi:hypothetical protein
MVLRLCREFASAFLRLLPRVERRGQCLRVLHDELAQPERRPSDAAARAQVLGFKASKFSKTHMSRCYLKERFHLDVRAAEFNSYPRWIESSTRFS